jgi:hypothetical protein
MFRIKSNFTVFAACVCIRAAMREPSATTGSFEASKGFETMTRTASKTSASEKLGELARTIRKQAAMPTTRRQLREMPAFKVVNDIPQHLQALLDELKDTERKAGI